MKLISFAHNGEEQAGLLEDDKVYSFRLHDASMPATMRDFLNDWENSLSLARELKRRLHRGASLRSTGIPIQEVQLLAPVPNPTSCRDGYAFRQHVAAARRNRKVPMIPEFDQYPIFYFTNHHSIFGPGDISCMPDHFEKLDYELEVAIVISKKGRNIRAGVADEYIGGLMIMNDWSARTLQMEEMLLSLGPAKGKDFATSLGPWLVPLDALGPFETSCKPGHTGKSWNLSMKASVNGELLSEGNLADMDWTFAELIERASYGVDLYPGDVIGSGTVGTGCLLELNGTGKLNDINYKERWIRPGDTVKLEVEALGVLANNLALSKDDFSILQLKKK